MIKHSLIIKIPILPPSANPVNDSTKRQRSSCYKYDNQCDYPCSQWCGKSLRLTNIYTAFKVKLNDLTQISTIFILKLITAF